MIFVIQENGYESQGIFEDKYYTDRESVERACAEMNNDPLYSGDSVDWLVRELTLAT